MRGDPSLRGTLSILSITRSIVHRTKNEKHSPAPGENNGPESTPHRDERHSSGQEAAEATYLAGVRVDGVEYWDLHNFGDEPREWDHAVMGMGLTTDSGPVSVVWTSTFYAHDLEVFNEPMANFVTQGDYGPEGWAVTEHPEWRSRTGQPVLAVDTLWERLEFGPARYLDGSIAGPARTVDPPVALRLDFPAGPVWFVAGIPTEEDGVLFAGDEIMVVFTAEAMLRFGFPAGAFTDPPRARADPARGSRSGKDGVEVVWQREVGFGADDRRTTSPSWNTTMVGRNTM